MSRRACLVFGIADVVSALLLALGVFVGLPDRWWLVDTGGALLILALGAAGGGLIAGTKWAEQVARAASALALAVGLAFLGAVALAASYLSGIYRPVGKGGAIIFILVGAMMVPYLVILPSLQLVWLGPPRRPS